MSQGGASVPAAIADGGTILDRLRRTQPYEILIYFILFILLALCLATAQLVVEDVDAALPRPAAAP